MRFAGQYYDSETGLHYNYHRYYDPSLGRYLRADPIGLAGGINPYLYVQNNPMNLIDPYGLIDWVKFWKYTNSVSGPYVSKFMRVSNRIESAIIDGVLGKIGIPTSGFFGSNLGKFSGPIVGAVVYVLTPADLSDPYLGQDGKWYWPDGTPVNSDSCP